MKIIEYMAKSCVYAQEHFSGDDLSPHERSFAMQATSYQIACFLAQNTIIGSGGVEWYVVHKELCDGKKSEAEWMQIFNKLITKFGGLKDDTE